MTGGAVAKVISFDEEKVAAPKNLSVKVSESVKTTTKSSKSYKTPAPVPSPSPPVCDGDFNSGVYLGAEVAEDLWADGGSSCSNIWSFEEEVDAYLAENYPTDTSDWRTNSCHEGMAQGAAQVVEKYEKQCLDDSPDECNDLGQAAAQQIAYEFCPFSAADSTSYSSPNYKESCRSVAYGICEGAIYGYVQQNGCDMTTSELSQEQAKCEEQVDSMTGGEEETAVATTSYLRKFALAMTRPLLMH
jgi:hypothetical protein